MKFYYFNSTHWDREWYQPFQHYRKYLLDTTEGLLNALENNPEFEKFTFDGQTIVLEDIVEIRPDWRERLERQIAAGRLNVGPWYVMPDEFLVSGEALIRNLLVGHEVAENFRGQAWPVGYLCDMFGHIAQMPQILKGFDISVIVAWRGFPYKLPPFLGWESPDGSRCNLLKLFSLDGYGDFTLHCSGWWDKAVDAATFKERFQAYVQRVQPYFGDTIVLSDALDHSYVHSDTPNFLRWIKELYPDAEVIHTDYRDLPEFAAPERLPVIHGEQIETCSDITETHAWQIPYTLSSRYDLKSANDRLQNALELNGEPMAAYQTMSGDRNNHQLLKFAWKTLLKNHAHDSICGCSVDAVHQVMKNRFDETAQIGEILTEDLIFQDREAITGKDIFAEAKNLCADDLSAAERSVDGEYTVRVFNSLPYSTDKVMTLDIAFPVGYPKTWTEPFSSERINAFRVYDAADQELTYGINTIKRNQVRRFYRQDSRTYDIYSVTVKPCLRPTGWTSLRIRPAENPVRRFTSQLTGTRQAENRFLKLRVKTDGTFDVTDKVSGRTYLGLNDFLIDREIGDGWGHVKPIGNSTIVGAMNSCTLTEVEDNPLRTSFEIVRTYTAPREVVFKGTVAGDYAGLALAEEPTTLKIISSVTLDTESRQIKVKTIVNNQVKDYRLRLVMPTGISGKYFTGQSFANIERNPGRESGLDSENYAEAEPLEKNFSGIVGKRDQHGGIALLSAYGLHEVSGSEYDSGDLFVTLLRAFRRTVMTNGESDGQVQGKLEYEYAYSLFGPETDYAALYRQNLQNRMTCPHYLVKTEAVVAEHDRSLLELNGDLTFSTFKPGHSCDCPGETVLRLFNPTDREVQGGLKLFKAVSEIAKCGLNEKDESILGTNISELAITLAPWQIMSLKIKW